MVSGARLVWYDMFTAILRDMGLTPSRHDPCLYSGKVSIPGQPPSSPELYVGIYVDDFVFYSTDPATEQLFRDAMARRITVDFMGEVDYFLGTAFTWKPHPDGNLSVHLCQSAFTEFTAHRFGVDKMN